MLGFHASARPRRTFRPLLLTAWQVTDIAKIRNAEIINESEIDTAAVSIGSVVTVEDEDGEQEEYVIVSQNEVDSFSNRISNQCPIGKALAGHRVGDLVTVMVENQKGVMISSYKLKILSVERKEKSEPHV